MREHVRALAVLVGLAMVSGFVADPAFADSTRSTLRDLHPSASAQASGIVRPGQAYMGWTQRSGADGGGQKPTATRGHVSSAQSTAAPGLQGVDVSGWNANVDWNSLYSDGVRFAYTKATEGNYFTSSAFDSQYTGSYNAGLIRGAYHFANPDFSSGADQAVYFVNHGGSLSGDGMTLPGVLDIEYNPYGPTCYGLSPSQLTNWIASFTGRYKALTGRDAVVYTTYDWWNQCTGNTTQFSRTNPLWIAYYRSTPGTLPGSWALHTFWQYTSTPVDQDWFNGTYAQLKKLAAPKTAAVPLCTTAPFPDVPGLSQFCTDISWLKSRGITGGYPDGRFHPTTAVSRQAFAHYLYQMSAAGGQSDGPCTTRESSGFPDVLNTNKFCKSIRALSKADVTRGYADAKFHPEKPVSRQAIAAMIHRHYSASSRDTTGACIVPFSDVTPKDQFCGDIAFMYNMGLSNGYADGGYHPTSQTSRQAIAAFLYQYDQVLNRR